MARSRKSLTSMSSEGMVFWRADSYRLVPKGSVGDMQAEPGAVWERYNPMEFYRPAGKTRDLEAGPHVDALKLKGLLGTSLWDSHNPSFDKASIEFANKYGLLGLFYEEYSMLNLPERKLWIAPEAVIEASGELREVDPATEGTELLLDLLDRQGVLDTENSRFSEKEAKREAARSKVVLPRELKFARKTGRGIWIGDPTAYDYSADVVEWEEARESYGGLIVLTENRTAKASVLCTREHTMKWWTAISDLPAGTLRPEDRVLRAFLNSCLVGVSPYSALDSKEMERDYRCSSLLEAMYLMLWLDLTGGRSIVKCEAERCPNWFRQGSQTRSMYCPNPEDPRMPSRCASRQASRKFRERSPNT